MWYKRIYNLYIDKVQILNKSEKDSKDFSTTTVQKVYLTNTPPPMILWYIYIAKEQYKD